MIHWNLTEQQADQILNTLAARPFAEVNGLITELMRQANAEKNTPAEVPLAQRGKPNGQDNPPVMNLGVGA